MEGDQCAFQDLNILQLCTPRAATFNQHLLINQNDDPSQLLQSYAHYLENTNQKSFY